MQQRLTPGPGWIGTEKQGTAAAKPPATSLMCPGGCCPCCRRGSPPPPVAALAAAAAAAVVPQAQQGPAVVPCLAAPAVVQHLVEHQHRLRQKGGWMGHTSVCSTTTLLHGSETPARSALEEKGCPRLFIHNQPQEGGLAQLSSLSLLSRPAAAALNYPNRPPVTRLVVADGGGLLLHAAGALRVVALAGRAGLDVERACHLQIGIRCTQQP